MVFRWALGAVLVLWLIRTSLAGMSDPTQNEGMFYRVSGDGTLLSDQKVSFAVDNEGGMHGHLNFSDGRVVPLTMTTASSGLTPNGRYVTIGKDSLIFDSAQYTRVKESDHNGYVDLTVPN